VIIAIAENNRRTLAGRLQTDDELRTSEGKLRESEEQFGSLANSIPELCWMAHGDGHIFWYNERWYEYTGTEPSQVEGWGWQSLHDPQILPAVLEHWRDCIRTGEPFEMEFPIRGGDGVFRWFLTRIRPIRDARGKVIRWFGINTNIHEQRETREALNEARQKLEKRVRERTSELNQANDSLRELSGALLQMQDDERRHIARELHDSVGQLLAAIGMNLGMLQSQNLDPAAAKLLTETTGLLDEVNRETRTISHLLHPPLLDEAGLASALRSYVEEFSQRSKIDVDIDIASGFGRLSKEMEIAFFRIVQECLTNIHRHSGSPTALVQIVQESGKIAVKIKDAGKGIPPARQLELSSSRRTGVGFRGMRERLRQLGGTLEIQSDTQGTLVIASLPIAQSSEQLLSRRAS
jgi:PAS domain S-box-containing protein